MTRKKKFAAILTLCAASAFGIARLSGCTSTLPVTGNLHVEEARSQKLMALAADEAGKISDVDMRLTRQLNLADLQSARDWNADARKTLAAARNTLSSPDAAKLKDHTRLSGWVSISQLSRRTNDLPGATLATDAGVLALDGIEDPARRCEYVMGLSNELQYTRDKHAAAELLAKAGPWTRSIDHADRRRQAIVAFSTALFNLDDFSAGQAMLGHEDDAAWRSDVLAGMAQIQDTNSKFAMDSRPAEARAMSAMAAPMLPSPAATQPFFGRNLNYEQVFKNQRSSQTTKD